MPVARLAVAAAIAAAAVLTLPVASAAHEGDEAAASWPQFQGNAEHSGSAPFAPPPPYKVAWRFPVEGGASAPVVSDGTVFATGRDTIVAVDAATGEERWTVDRAASDLLVPPAIVHTEKGDLLVFTEGAGKETKITAVRAGDGLGRRELTTLGADSTSGISVEGTTAFAGDSSGTIYAVDAVEGGQRWRAKPGDAPITSPPVVAGGTVFATSVSDRGLLTFIALSPESGDVRWQSQPDALPFLLGMSAEGGRVYFTSVSGIAPELRATAIDLTKRSEAWSVTIRRPLLAPPFAPSAPAAAGERVYAFTVSSALVALDAASGAVVWDYQFDDVRGYPAGPLIAGEAVLAGLVDGSVVSVDAASGRATSRTRVGSDPVTGLAASDEAVFAGMSGSGGGLVALVSDSRISPTNLASPTALNAGRMARSFFLAFVVVAGGIFLLTRLAGGLVAKRRSAALPPDPWEPGNGEADGE